MLDDLESHSSSPGYSGNVVSQFQFDWINTQGEMASHKKVQRMIILKNWTKLSIFGHI